MEWPDIEQDLRDQLGAASKPDLRPLDRSLVQFIEALAIADARRDHIALSETITRHEARGQRAGRAGAQTNDACGHLRKILD